MQGAFRVGSDGWIMFTRSESSLRMIRIIEHLGRRERRQEIWCVLLCGVQWSIVGMSARGTAVSSANANANVQ